MKKKIFQFSNKHHNKAVVIELVPYSNGRTAIALFTIEQEPLMVASVNVPSVHLEEDEVIIKDYSENEGVLKFLEDNNIVHATPYAVQVGHTYCKICILQPEEKWLSASEEPAPVGYNDEGKKKWVIDGYNIWASSYQDALSHYAVIRQL